MVSSRKPTEKIRRWFSTSLILSKYCRYKVSLETEKIPSDST